MGVIKHVNISDAFNKATYDFSKLDSKEYYQVFYKNRSYGHASSHAKAYEVGDDINAARIFRFLRMTDRDLYFKSVKGGYIETFPRHRGIIVVIDYNTKEEV